MAKSHKGKASAEDNSEREVTEVQDTSSSDTQTDELTILTSELTAEKDKFLRLAAEYDNYRKRSQKEREAVFADVRVDTVVRLLPVYDNLKRALSQSCEDESFYKGVEMTMTQLLEILEGMGVSVIKAMGEPFNPELHNAIMSIEDAELGENIVKEDVQSGFVLGERVIRFASVIVANCK